MLPTSKPFRPVLGKPGTRPGGALGPSGARPIVDLVVIGINRGRGTPE
jgi:hypothetical protein